MGGGVWCYSWDKTCRCQNGHVMEHTGEQMCLSMGAFHRASDKPLTMTGVERGPGEGWSGMVSTYYEPLLEIPDLKGAEGERINSQMKVQVYFQSGEVNSFY